MTINLPSELEHSIRDLVKKGRFASPDDAISEAWRTFLQRESAMERTGSDESEETVFDLLSRAGLIGCVDGAVDGPTDLSTNSDHMEGFGIE